jgi:hypothetical protein
VAVLPLRQSTGGASGSFLVAGDDGRRYWCKSLNNLQGARVPVTEQIVGRFGRLLGVAVCEVALVHLDGIAGWEFRSGRLAERGWAHGSLAVDPALETRDLARRSEDDNRRRHAGFYALNDWLLGSDQQWLCAPDEDNAYYSHDHGLYLGGLAWTSDLLEQFAATPMPLSIDPTGLDRDELERLADRLEKLGREEMEAELSKIPAHWPVTDEELLAVIDTAHTRRAAVAERLRRLAP